MSISVIAFSAAGYLKDSIFDLNSSLNRDNCFFPYYLLRHRFKEFGIEIHTADLVDGGRLYLDLDTQSPRGGVVSYLLMMETSHISPCNGIYDKRAHYKRVFTWDDTLVDNDRYIKINFPNIISVPKADGYFRRDKLCCMVSSNKNLVRPDARNLYLERVKAIRWFEKNAPEDFELYGHGWDAPAAKIGIWGKVERRLWRLAGKFIPRKPFPSYKGRVSNKQEVLVRTRFCICYENVRDLPGYITEKIFDCFFAGCIPIYWGASNIADYIPASCFIDRRAFSSMDQLYAFIQGMSEESYIEYQNSVINFLQSSAVYPFSAECFARTIVDTIVQEVDK
ncbi:glycosyltransferase family 10 [Pseudomonas otitidis]|uniref:glycosyltransferase family 10 domain-containing protein n=1 Tax=Metapseudomonas otitidis TaxID=319939 RepID=UPI00244B307C|nr:glycosyltransferase family 10 [Pseudomonas otitidis]MDH1109310.1 glycosyltransferase family 10 [Pseudomonas otitidis]MDH1157575.1 glycosyltransferase family 10 [Pseudomonas otitidis]MDH1166319.1 glycosyltransferase family 10 [Pseudomonas otitidis]